MQHNQQIVEEAFEKWSRGQGSILDLMEDDGIVLVPGTAAHCGSLTKRDFVATVAKPFMSRFSKPPVPRPSLVLADGDNVVVVAEAEGTTLDGNGYRNEYIFLLEFRDGLLIKATEFLDMLAFNVVWNSVVPESQHLDSLGGPNEALGNR